MSQVPTGAETSRTVPGSKPSSLSPSSSRSRGVVLIRTFTGPILSLPNTRRRRFPRYLDVSSKRGTRMTLIPLSVSKLRGIRAIRNSEAVQVVTCLSSIDKWRSAMALDEQLLKKARSHGARLADVEREAQLSRADYHSVVRRLHLG